MIVCGELGCCFTLRCLERRLSRRWKWCKKLGTEGGGKEKKARKGGGEGEKIRG